MSQHHDSSWCPMNQWQSLVQWINKTKNTINPTSDLDVYHLQLHSGFRISRNHEILIHLVKRQTVPQPASLRLPSPQTPPQTRWCCPPGRSHSPCRRHLRGPGPRRFLSRRSSYKPWSSCWRRSAIIKNTWGRRTEKSLSVWTCSYGSHDLWPYTLHTWEGNVSADETKQTADQWIGKINQWVNEVIFNFSHLARKKSIFSDPSFLFSAQYHFFASRDDDLTEINLSLEAETNNYYQYQFI